MSAFKTRPEVAFHLRAFTLLELLVAISITALLVGFIVILVANVSGFWSRSSGRLSAEAQARFILDQLTLDLQSAMFRGDGVALAVDVLTDKGNSGLWLSDGEERQKPAHAAGTALRYDAPDIAAVTFGQAGVWLRLFATQRANNTSVETLSAPVAVGWQLVRRAGTNAPGSRDHRYFLHRAVISPPQLLQAGLDLTAVPYASGTSVLRRPPVESIVGENVIDFGMRFYAYDAHGALVRIFPHAGELSHHATLAAETGDPATRFPAVVDVMVRILTEEGARLIAAFEADPPRMTRPSEYASEAEYWWSVALVHSHVFTRRIALPARGPS